MKCKNGTELPSFPHKIKYSMIKCKKNIEDCGSLTLNLWKYEEREERL